MDKLDPEPTPMLEPARRAELADGEEAEAVAGLGSPVLCDNVRNARHLTAFVQHAVSPQTACKKRNKTTSDRGSGNPPRPDLRELNGRFILAAVFWLLLNADKTREFQRPLRNQTLP
jgi:hypothetical protein